MAFNPQDKSNQGVYEIPNAGLEVARCIRVVELGVQETKFGDKKSVEIWYAIPNQTMEFKGEIKQRIIGTGRLTLSNDDRSTLYRHVTVLNPAATRLDELLDKTCMISIVHNTVGDRTYANIDSIVPLMQGVEVPEADTDMYYFDLDNFDREIWDKLSEYKQNKIMEAKDWDIDLGEES